MEERLKSLKQAIQDAEKGKNTNTEKFESLWDLQPFISKTPKVIFTSTDQHHHLKIL
jgi:hypothetical protein